MSGDELDEAIDQGLRDYVAQEPAFGMELSVLRRVHRRDSRLRLAWAVAACGLVGILAARMWQRPVETLAITPLSARIEIPAPTGLRGVGHRTSITAGERALLRFVEDHPEQALEAFAKPNNPVTVEQIDIPPLAIEPLETQEENKK